MLKKIKSNSNWSLLIGMMGVIVIITASLTFYLSVKQEQGVTINPEVQLNPDKEYQITYWDYPLFIGQDKDYEEFLQKAISEFNDMYPNIKVNYKLLSFIRGKKKLNERLKAGEPPDIYNDIFGDKLLGEELQIPVNIFFTKKDRENYNSLGIKAFTYNQRVWGLPNWLMPRTWIGNRKLLAQTNLDLNRIQNQGWSWETFYQTAKEVKELDRESCVIFNPYNPQLFYQLLSMNNNQELISSQGDLLLTDKDLKTTFEFLSDLRSHEVFYKEPEEMNKKLLPYFWQGKAGVIAPVNMWLLNNLYQREQKEENVELTLLPIPNNDPAERKVPLKITGLTLFRQQEYKGDVHTKAAYKFARFLNQQKNLFIAKNLKVLPAYVPLESHWRKEVKLKKELKNQLLTYIERGSYRELSGFKNHQLEERIKNSINENYEAFWLKGAPISKVTKKIIKDCREILNIKENTENVE